MLPIDWVELSKIAATALIGAILGYAIHWLQTKQEREWQKRREQQHMQIQKLEEQRQAIGRLIQDLVALAQHDVLKYNSMLTFLDQPSNWPPDMLLMWRDKLMAEVFENKAREKVTESNSALSAVELPEDEQLKHLRYELYKRLGESSQENNEIITQWQQARTTSANAQALRTALIEFTQEVVQNSREDVLRFSEIGGQIDQRFGELKAQILEESA